MRLLLDNHNRRHKNNDERPRLLDSDSIMLLQSKLLIQLPRFIHHSSISTTKTRTTTTKTANNHNALPTITSFEKPLLRTHINYYNYKRYTWYHETQTTTRKVMYDDNDEKMNEENGFWNLVGYLCLSTNVIFCWKFSHMVLCLANCSMTNTNTNNDHFHHHHHNRHNKYHPPCRRIGTVLIPFHPLGMILEGIHLGYDHTHFLHASCPIRLVVIIIFYDKS